MITLSAARMLLICRVPSLSCTMLSEGLTMAPSLTRNTNLHGIVQKPYIGQEVNVVFLVMPFQRAQNH